MVPHNHRSPHHVSRSTMSHDPEKERLSVEDPERAINEELT